MVAMDLAAENGHLHFVMAFVHREHARPRSILWTHLPSATITASGVAIFEADAMSSLLRSHGVRTAPLPHRPAHDPGGHLGGSGQSRGRDGRTEPLLAVVHANLRFAKKNRGQYKSHNKM